MATPLTDYMNRAEVRAALNIPSFVQEWELCLSDPRFNYNFVREGSIWIYPVLRPYGYQMLVYSGTTDGVIPTIGTRIWIDSLGWPTTSAWQPWVSKGYITGFT